MRHLMTTITYLILGLFSINAIAAEGAAVCSKNDQLHKIKYDNQAIEIDGRRFLHVGDYSDHIAVYASHQTNRCRATKLFLDQRASSIAVMLDDPKRFRVNRNSVLKAFYCVSQIYQPELDIAEKKSTKTNEPDWSYMLDKLNCLPSTLDDSEDWQKISCNDALNLINRVKDRDKDYLSEVAKKNLNEKATPILIGEADNYFEYWTAHVNKFSGKIYTTYRLGAETKVVSRYNCEFFSHVSIDPSIPAKELKPYVDPDKK